MDWARSCHRGVWRLFKDRPEVLTAGRFYFAEEGVTPYYPFFHNYWNGDWVYEREEPQTPPPLGEDRSLRLGYSKGILGTTRPGAALVGSAECVRFGEAVYPAPERLMPNGIDAACYPEGSVPVYPPAGMLLWHTPAGLPSGADGDPIGSWADDSGNGNVPTQGISTRRPTLENVGLGSLKAAVFYAAGSIPRSLVYGVDAVGVGHPLPLGAEYTVYLVGTTDDTFATAAGPSIGVDVFPAQTPLAAGQGNVVSGTDLDTVTVADGVGVAESHIWSVRRAGGALELSMDGVPLTTAAVDPAGVSTFGGLIAYITFVASRRRCKFSEVLAYAWRLDDANHANTVAYLKGKFGL